MFGNYIKIAIRNILKHRLYAAINILGLAIGLAVFLFGGILADYEQNHDTMFEKHQRIFTVGSVFNPEANIGVLKTDGVYAAFGPIIETSVEDIEAVARTKRREFLVSVGENGFYEQIRFTDPTFTQIFDLDYIQGGPEALAEPDGLIITRSTAEKLFGAVNVVGEVVSLDNQQDMKVAAVIEDLPKNSHFNSMIIVEEDLNILANMKMLETIDGYVAAEDWGNLSMTDNTYMLLPADKDRVWLQSTLDALYMEHYPVDQREFITGVEVHSLQQMNGFIWDAIGIPTFLIIQFLGLLVLIVACVNYANLAIAQSLGRAREVGLRKTLGASRKRLLAQFLTESLTLVTIAIIVSLVMLEAVIPLFNGALDKVLTIEYARLLPWFMFVVMVVGLVSGFYPAMLITRTSPIEALRDAKHASGRRQWLRSILIGVQFFFTITMLGLVAVMHLQNLEVERSAEIYPRDQMMVLGRMGVSDIRERHDTLRRELLAIPGVRNVAYSSQVPFEQSNSTFAVTRVEGDKENEFGPNAMYLDHAFIATYGIPVIAGREFDRNNPNDTEQPDATSANVMINAMMAERLGFASPQEAVGEVFFEGPDNDVQREYRIIGVVEDQNVLGLHNVVKPWVLRVVPTSYRKLSLYLAADDVAGTAEQVRQVWQRIIPDYPIQPQYLVDYFNGVYNIFRTMNQVLAGFAIMALVLALVGLFGVSAFMAESRTREIGLRKVMGANIPQIVRMMIFQFSFPVMISLVVSLAAVFLMSGLYLETFANRIDLPIGEILGAGAVAVVLAWSVVAGHAIRVARANPILALRYE